MQSLDTHKKISQQKKWCAQLAMKSRCVQFFVTAKTKTMDSEIVWPRLNLRCIWNEASNQCETGTSCGKSIKSHILLRRLSLISCRWAMRSIHSITYTYG